MKTDVTAIKVELADLADALSGKKREVRRVVDPNRVWGFIPGREDGEAVPISRRVVLRAGRNMTPLEGKEYHAAKLRVTALCTIRAAMRGRFHSPTFLRSPELLEQLAATWRTFEDLPVVEAGAPVEVPAEDTVKVVAG